MIMIDYQICSEPRYCINCSNDCLPFSNLNDYSFKMINCITHSLHNSVLNNSENWKFKPFDNNFDLYNQLNFSNNEIYNYFLPNQIRYSY